MFRVTSLKYSGEASETLDKAAAVLIELSLIEINQAALCFMRHSVSCTRPASSRTTFSSSIAGRSTEQSIKSTYFSYPKSRRYALISGNGPNRSGFGALTESSGYGVDRPTVEHPWSGASRDAVALLPLLAGFFNLHGGTEMTSFNRGTLVGNPLGRVAERLRDAIERHGASLESVGTVANDQLAEILVTRLATRHFVDVGAHIGSIIAAVRQHCSSVRITAVEPIPGKAANLRRRFPNIDLFECALSDQETSASFFVNPKLSGYSSLNPAAGDVELTVQLKRLDDLVTDPDVVKIDVEGAELGVLRGAERLKTRPVYMFESGPEEVLGYTKADLWRWFSEREYEVFLPNRLAHTAPPMGIEVFLDSHLYPRRTTNYFGVPKEQVPDIRGRARSILQV